MTRILYDTEKFPFQRHIQELFGVKDLTMLNDNVEVFKRENDQNTVWHKRYYDWARTDVFRKLYRSFIGEIIYPQYAEPIVYQAIPTFRIAYPNNIAVGEFHKDKHYRDSNWATSVHEENYFFPMTNAYDTNTIWAESEEDKGDFAPMNCKYGEIIRWDGSNLTHGNRVNTTGKCRVSVDFRVIRLSNYLPSEYQSINTNTKFQIGGYYEQLG